MNDEYDLIKIPYGTYKKSDTNKSLSIRDYLIRSKLRNKNIDDEMFYYSLIIPSYLEKEKEKHYRNILNIILKYVSNRDMEVIKMFYGIMSYQPTTLTEIGKKYGITSSRAAQLRDRGISSINSILLKKGFKRMSDLINSEPAQEALT